MNKGERRMKKLLILGTLALVVALSAGAAGLAFAQTPGPELAADPNTDVYPNRSQIRDGMAQMMSRMMGQRAGGTMGACQLGEPGVMHGYMVAAWANVLGLDASDLQARLDGGERMVDIALSQGYSFEEVRVMMVEAKTAALEQAVEDGIISPEQAEQMQQRIERMPERGGMGQGKGMHGGMRGFGNRGAQPQQ
jgi:hypothetical protein